MTEQKFPFEDGPYLSAAFLCERVLNEQDGVKSAIRIVDRVNRQAVGPEPPADMEPFDYQVTLFIRFKSGRIRGTRTIEAELVKPSGESKPVMRAPVLFEGEDDRGIDLVAVIGIRFEITGVYWFNISLDGIRVSRIPFRVVYMPHSTAVATR